MLYELVVNKKFAFSKFAAIQPAAFLLPLVVDFCQTFSWLLCENDIWEAIQKQPSLGVLIIRCSENMQQIYGRTNVPKCDFNKVALGEDTRWNISFRLFHETQFNVYFITFNLISWNSYKIYKKEASANYDRKKMNTEEDQVFSLLLIEHIFSKKATKQKTTRKRSLCVKPRLKNCMYTSAFNLRSW